MVKGFFKRMKNLNGISLAGHENEASVIPQPTH
jgi:hypothetical protein